MSPNFTLIIPTYRNPKYLELCLRSAVTHRTDENNHILVVVDGFPEETQPVLDMFPGVRSLVLDENKGMQYAINIGVMQSETPLVFIANDDQVFGEDWDHTIAQDFVVAEDDRGKMVLTVNQIEPTGPSLFNFPIFDCGQTVETFNMDLFLSVERQAASEKTTLDGAIFPFIMRKVHFMAVGGFDTFYDSPNWCDTDFFLKLEILGFRFQRTHAVHLYHFGSVATKKNSESPAFRAREHVAAETFLWKWGFLTPIAENTRHNNRKLPQPGGIDAIRGIKQ